MDSNFLFSFLLLKSGKLSLYSFFFFFSFFCYNFSCWGSPLPLPPPPSGWCVPFFVVFVWGGGVVGCFDVVLSAMDFQIIKRYHLPST